MKNIPFLLIFAFALLAGILFSSCKNAINTSSELGDITGYVQVYDTNYKLMTNNSGVLITIEGTSFSTVSDDSGKWDITNVPAGDVTLALSKQGYAPRKFSFHFIGNITYHYTTQIYPIPILYPDITLSPFVDYVVLKNGHVTNQYTDSTGHVHFDFAYDTVITPLDLATFSSRSQYKYHNQNITGIMIFGINQNLDIMTPSSWMYEILSTSNADTGGVLNFTFHRSALLAAGFSDGDKIYCIAYAGTAVSSEILWVDPITNKQVYSGFSPYRSEVKSFILP